MGGFSSLASAGINLALAQQANQRANRQISRDRNRDIAEIQARTEEERRDQQSALRQRIAAQRARAGASGVSTSGGSIDAVIRGLERNAAEDLASLNSSANRRIDNIRDQASQSRRRSLLDLTTRLTGAGRNTRSLLR